MMYLAVKHAEGGVATIAEMARAYGISRTHLTKIVNELSQNGFIETTRGRAGGARLARLPSQISVGSLVRMAEKDFAVVQCHAAGREVNCAILPACNLRNGLHRAVSAFLYELDRMTLEDAIITPSVSAFLLHIRGAQAPEVSVPIGSLLSSGRPGTKSGRPAPKAGRRSTRRH